MAEFRVFCDLLDRCFNPNNARFQDWGGRGVTVDEEWNTVVKFHAFLQEVGPRPSDLHSIDRIDNNGGYVKGNMRWATTQQQSRNRRSNVWVIVKGETLCVRDAAKSLGLTRWQEMKLARFARGLVEPPVISQSCGK